MTIDELLALAPFDAVQVGVAKDILAQFSAAGVGELGLAAVVNAWAESMLDPLVCTGRTPWGADRGFGPIPGGEDSCGLFQLNAAPAAAGAGMTVEERQDPRTNTARIIEVVKSPSGDRLRGMVASGAPLGDLIAVFTEDIERPANRVQEGLDRAEMAGEWGWPVYDSSWALPVAVATAGMLPLLAIVLVGALGLAYFTVKA